MQYKRNFINLAGKKDIVRIIETAIDWIKYYHGVICFHMDFEIINLNIHKMSVQTV